MIPLWIWPALVVVCLLALAEWECHCINRTRDNMRDIEARARANAAPLGNVHRVYDRTQEDRHVA